jgi:preprotein translocase subunit SecE
LQILQKTHTSQRNEVIFESKEVVKMDKKPNVFARIKNWFVDMKAELKRVVWPSFAKVRQNTLIVLIFVLVVGAVIWILDWLFSSGIALLINR